MATPYQNVAKAALINWNGLSEEEAISKINNESYSFGTNRTKLE